MKKMKNFDSKNMPKAVDRKITLIQLIGLSIAFFGSIRNVPQVASAGLSSIMWMVISIIIFTIPLGLIAAELATGWSKRGGPAVWVQEAFGKRAGFITAWLLWVQMFFGMVIISVGLSTMLAFVVDNPMVWSPILGKDVNLASEPVYILVSSVVIYWILTLMNLYSKKVGKSLINIGAVIGIYIPFICLILFGGIFIIQQAVTGNHDLINNIPPSFIPNEGSTGILPQSTNGLSLFSQIMWIFIGLEIASTRANEIDNPKKNYSLALLIVLILMVVFNLGAGFIYAAIVPSADIQLQNAVITPFEIIFNSWNMPGLTNVMALLIAFGIFSQLNSWILGPSNSMYSSAVNGTMPTFFHKKNKNDEPIVFVIIQACAVTFFSVVYFVLSIFELGNVFGILLNETIILYCIAYVFMILSFIKLKYSKPDVKRGFVVPFKKVGAWIATITALTGVTAAIVMTFLQNQSTLDFLLIQDIGIYLGVTVMLLAIPLFISLTKKFKTNKWLVKQELAIENSGS